MLWGTVRSEEQKGNPDRSASMTTVLPGRGLFPVAAPEGRAGSRQTWVGGYSEPELRWVIQRAPSTTAPPMAAMRMSVSVVEDVHPSGCEVVSWRAMRAACAMSAAVTVMSTTSGGSGWTPKYRERGTRRTGWSSRPKSGVEGAETDGPPSVERPQRRLERGSPSKVPSRPAGLSRTARRRAGAGGRR